MESFANIHKSLSDLDGAIDTAQLKTFGDSGTAVAMMTNFADSDKALIALDSILLILSLLGAGVWGQGKKCANRLQTNSYSVHRVNVDIL